MMAGASSARTALPRFCYTGYRFHKCGDTFSQLSATSGKSGKLHNALFDPIWRSASEKDAPRREQLPRTFQRCVETPPPRAGQAPGTQQRGWMNMFGIGLMSP